MLFALCCLAAAGLFKVIFFIFVGANIVSDTVIVESALFNIFFIIIIEGARAVLTARFLAKIFLVYIWLLRVACRIFEIFQMFFCESATRRT